MVDATCPYVSKVQQHAKELADAGYAVVIIGEPKHAEVEGIRAWGGKAVVAVADEPSKLPETLPAKVGVVIQTTQSEKRVNAVLSCVRELADEVLVKETVCNATQVRQRAAAELASRVDAMVVIGGHNSGNTHRLYEVCKPLCPATYHIESTDELDPVAFKAVEHVGITAGASTPASQIEEVKRYLENL